MPIYRKLGEFSSKRVRQIMTTRNWRCYLIQRFRETLPAELLRRKKLISRPEALRLIHFPAEDTPLTLTISEAQPICDLSSKTFSGLRRALAWSAAAE